MYKRQPLDIRIIAATNRNLEQMVKDGQFRLDLYYRLNVVTVEIPPLRERTVEIPLLVNAFLNRFNQKYSTRKTMGASAMDVLMQHDWPGNIRELMHTIESLVVIGTNDVITDVYKRQPLSSSARFTSASTNAGGSLTQSPKMIFSPDSTLAPACAAV